MSERFQKTFISVTEFVESWDKELYELNNLDFFIYLMINHLGNQLEKQFFIQDKKNSPLYLDFEQLGTVCFNLGDGFEVFLEENCLGSCPLNCPRDLDGVINLKNIQLENQVKRNLHLLQSILMNQLDKEQCLRIDLLNHVILDTLLQFYNDELQMDIDEQNLFLIELAEFIEDVIISFIRNEGQMLLMRPFDNALTYFEDLLQSEADDYPKQEWGEEGDEWQKEKSGEEWQKLTESIDDVFSRYLSDIHYNPMGSGSDFTNEIRYFKRYLQEYAGVEKIYEVDEHHLGEFFGVWLAQEFVMSDEKLIQSIFRATARFVTFLFHHYDINLKKDFLKYYEALKLDLPRVVQAMNLYISEYDLLNALLSAEQDEVEQKFGFFEITEIHQRSFRYLDLRNIQSLEVVPELRISFSAYSRLRKGDILKASLINGPNGWEIRDIEYIYPNMAKRFLV